MQEAEYKSPLGYTALMLAARHGNSKCIAQLISEAGHVDNRKRTALMQALEMCEKDCIQLLWQEMKNQNYFDCSKLLLEAGIDGSYALRAIGQFMTFTNLKFVGRILQFEAGLCDSKNERVLDLINSNPLFKS